MVWQDGGGNFNLVSVAEEMRKNRLNWFGRVVRRDKRATVILAMKMDVEGVRGKING